MGDWAALLQKFVEDPAAFAPVTGGIAAAIVWVYVRVGGRLSMDVTKTQKVIAAIVVAVAAEGARQLVADGAVNIGTLMAYGVTAWLAATGVYKSIKNAQEARSGAAGE